MVSTTKQVLCDHGSAGAKRQHSSEAEQDRFFFYALKKEVMRNDLD